MTALQGRDAPTRSLAPRGSGGGGELAHRFVAHVARPAPPGWWVAVGVCLAGTLLLLGTLAYSVAVGVGTWGNNIPVAWALAILHFVWWGHAGGVISTGLFLMEKPWRSGIARLAEALGVISMANALIFPLLHMGRPWFFYWLIPYPSSLEVWPQFRSSLTWDVISLMAMLFASLALLFLGLIPDFATLRDHAPGTLRKRVYGALSLGWKGSGRDWQRYRITYGLVAALVLTLGILVQSVASLDFSSTLLPGWHATSFPPGFVVRGVYSGFAVLLVLTLAVRRWYRASDVLTERHLEGMARALLVLAWALAYVVLIEAFVGWYTGNQYSRYLYLVARPAGPYSLLFWAFVVLTLLTPQLLWSRRLRSDRRVLLLTALAAAAGLWLDRFIIVITSQSRGFLPSAWASYAPSWVEAGIFVGTLGLFGLLFLLFLRVVPFAPVHELQMLRHQGERRERR